MPTLMQLIKELVEDFIPDEINDAKKYAKRALKYKDEFPEFSRTFDTLSRQEMEHKSMLHSVVTAAIEKYREEHGEPPTDMQAIYDYLHQKSIDNAAEVKTLQGMFR